jgi:hypothetical protein
LAEEYKKVIVDLCSLMGKVEREQQENIDKEKENLLKTMSDLVIKAVQVGVLQESELINEESRNNNAERQAPMTYSEALRVYQESKSQIAAPYRDKALVQRMGAAAMFAARHAQQVNERVAMLQTQLKISAPGGVSVGGTMSSGRTQENAQPEGKSSGTERVSLEKLVLQEEDRLRSISAALKLKDLRDLPLEKQVEAIRRAAADTASQPNSEATKQDLEARLEIANKGIQQGMAGLAEKDKQLAEKDKQLAEKNKQLAEKNKQLKTMKEKLLTMKLM